MIGDWERTLSTVRGANAVEGIDLEIALLQRPHGLAARMVESFGTAECVDFLLKTARPLPRVVSAFSRSGTEIVGFGQESPGPETTGIETPELRRTIAAQISEQLDLVTA
jgi:hypothetical protein